MTTPMKTKKIQLKDASSGSLLGEVDVTKSEYYNIEARSPQGVFRADELVPEEWTRLGLQPDQKVYFDGVWLTQLGIRRHDDDQN